VARTRSGEDLIDDAYLRADLVGATDRHPRTTVLRHVNQGGAKLYGLLIEARGKAFYAKKPGATITTAANTSRYSLASVAPDFLMLTAVRAAGPGGYTLDPFTTQDEPALREPGVTSFKPTHYELQPGYLELLPLHSANQSIIVDYVPVFPDLTDSATSTYDGINGWEEYLSAYAASRMLDRDDEASAQARQEQFMAAMAVEIGKLAKSRDGFRAQRVKNVRGGNGTWRRW
jgi:hypothetical protein